MSTQRGNHIRSRPQAHKNRHVFKNTLHDTSSRTKFINSIQISDVCMRCKDIIEWKIKYKKYKPLSQPKKCVRCSQKTVTKAYHVMCRECGKANQVCTKCCQPKEIIPNIPDREEQLKLDAEMKNLLQTLPERRRRTFLRYMSKKEQEQITENVTKESQQMDLMAKLNALRVDDISDSDDDEDFEDSEEEN